MATTKRRPRKSAPLIGADRVAQAIQYQAVGMRGLTPQRLTRVLDDFSTGHLRDAALLWQKMRERDDVLVSVTEKRELDAALLDWEILTVDESPEAGRHKEALEAFYNNLSATHTLDENQRGGIATLIRQMMHSAGHKYAVHEIVWDPTASDLTAEFRFVPLQFFENTTGRLRYLPTDGAYRGIPLEDGGWMVTVGAGLMQACSIAYFYKHLPLRAWLSWCDKFGMPGLHGETPAAPGSDEWKKFREALAAFAQDWALITTPGSKITPIEASATGTAPHVDLVERMDRAMARVWRGADLGTMSQEGEATGSNPQESETDILAAADAILISETLQHYVDAYVIRYRFGTDPLAYFQLRPKQKVNQDLELRIDDYLIKWGCGRAKNDLLSKYGRPEPDAGEELATAPSAGLGMPGAGGFPPRGNPFANEASGRKLLGYLDKATAQYNEAVREALRPVLARLAQIAAMQDTTAQRAALSRFQAAWPEVVLEVKTRLPEAAKVLTEIIGPAVISGYVEHAAKTGPGRYLTLAELRAAGAKTS